MCNMVTIHLMEDRKLKSELVCEKGVSLLSALQEYGFIPAAVCGGRGICGACTVCFTKEAPLPTPTERAFFRPDQLREGRRLACRITVNKDLFLKMPEAAENPNVLFGKVEKEAPRTDVCGSVQTNVAGTESATLTGGETEELPESPYLTVVDLGTTTIAMELRETASGKTVGQYAALNPQRKYGADVISRMEAALADEKQAKKLTALVQQEMQRGLTYFRHHFPETNMQKPQVFIAGNTVMLHLFAGLSVEGLSKYPFTPVTTGFYEMQVGEYQVTLLPGISAFVGADIVADLYALDMIPECTPEHRVTDKVNDEKPRFLADLGTNAELAYFDGETLTVTATAAGPAFEGGITAGVFGADLVRLTAGLLETKQLDHTGLLQGEAFENGVEIEGIRLQNKDIRTLQLAKAAVAAGIESLKPDSDTEFYLAGGFGYYLDPDSAIRIGLLPGISAETIHAVGNLVPEGIYAIARDLAQGELEKEAVEKALRRVSVINLAELPEFQERYLKHIDFPG